MRWCLLRGAAELGTLDGDVDLLVHPAHMETLRQVLAQRDFAAPRSWGRGSHRFFVAPVDEGVLKLDVVTALEFGRYQELRSDAAGEVLTRATRSGDVRLPAPADAFWALLLHVLLDRGRIKAERANELQALARVAPASGASPVMPALPEGWDGARVIATAAAGQFDELLALKDALRACWPGADSAAVRLKVLQRRVLRAVDRRLPQSTGAMTSYNRSRLAG